MREADLNSSALVQEALAKIREWAAETRPLLSEPDPGMEWQVSIDPPTSTDLDPKTNTLQLRYEWVLVDVGSAP